jgi:hypothetical protein
VGPSITGEGREKILSGIAEFTQKKAVQRNPFISVIYNPLLSFVFALPILVFLSVFMIISLFKPPESGLTRLVFISGSALLENNQGKPLQAGNYLGENDRIYVPRVCDLALGDRADFRLFPGTHFTPVRFSPSSTHLLMSLQRGSIYISKQSKFELNKTLGIQIDEYRFLLEGTRVLLQHMGQKIRVFCFEGKVRVISDTGEKERELFSLFSGERVEIRTEGLKRTYSINDFLEEPEILFDRALAGFPPCTSKMLQEHAHLLQTDYEPEEQPAQEERDAGQPSEEGPAETGVEAIDEQELFSVIKIGSIRDESITDRRINFITTAEDPNKGYILTQNNLFVLEQGGLLTTVRFPSTPIFKVKPVISESNLFCVSTRNLYIIDRKSSAVTAEIPLPVTGSAEDNYYPSLYGNTLYIPVLNNGYYTIKTDEPGSRLKKLYDELFPVSPIPAVNEIIIGSSYENYVAAIDENGTLLWKYPLEGKSYSNVVHIKNNICAYTFSNGKPRIISIDDNGIKHKEWLLEDSMTADMIAYGETLFGFYVNGTLFRLNTLSGTLENIAVLYEPNLPSKAWRTIQPCISGRLLYAGTSDGELFIYDIESGKIVYRIGVRKEEGIYTTPILIGRNIYCVTNSGAVYMVVKNDR